MKRYLAVICLLSLLPLSAARADSFFDPDFVMSDTDMTDTTAPAGYAQKFIEQQGGGIAKMKFRDPIDGISLKPPGDIIDTVGKIYGVNPKYLLTLIQKEQSLVTDPSPSSCQVNWATGYNRPDGSTCADRNRPGDAFFSEQVAKAANFVKCFLRPDPDDPTCGDNRSFGFHVGRPVVIDNTPVTPVNAATAMLYSYTPHLHGNQLVESIWNKWFVPAYPDGTVLAGEDGGVYLIQGGLKRVFASKSAMMSRVGSGKVIKATDAVLATYADGAPIKFPEYSLVRVPKGTVYLLVRDSKRPIASMKVFRQIGFNADEIINADPADLASYSDGAPVTAKSSFPTGALLQDKKTGGVYWVEDGVKQPIYSKEIMVANFPGRKPNPVAKATLDKYKTGDPVKFRDGQLVTGGGADRAVYMISNGQRRPFVSGQVFEQLGYSWDKVVATNDKALEIHPLGASINANSESLAAAQPASGS